MLRFGTVLPMLAVRSEPFSDAEFRFEAKLDGIRCMAFVDTAGHARLQNRRLRDITASYPDVVAAVERDATRSGIYDGELVLLDEGVPNFRRLMERENSDPRKAARMAESHPATLYLFDILWSGRKDLRDEPLDDRREILGKTVAADSVPLSPFLRADGVEIFRRVVAAGFEGIVAKRATSPYVTGARSPHWRKVKKGSELDAVVGGWTAGEGRRGGTIGSLVIGLTTPDGLEPLGSVGSGLADADLRQLLPRLERLATTKNPFVEPLERRTQFVRPKLVVKVAYHERGPEGRLRAPVFMGLRDDKAASECTAKAQGLASAPRSRDRG
ncbi:MAG: non-homologous end-joining DNA ligase [Thermoplasmatota archaeon]